MPLSLDGTTGISASGNIVGNNISVSGTLSAGTFSPSSLSASGNITGGNLVTAGLITATGNITGGNLLLSGNLFDSGTTLQISTTTSANISLAPNQTIVLTATTTGANITGTLNASGNIDGGNLRTAGVITATGNITGGNLSVSTGTVSVGNIVNTNANGVGNIGSASLYYNTVFAKATSAQYADLAEMYLADGPLHPGTLVEFGGANEVTMTTLDHSSRVAGVVSTRPSHLMNAGLSGQHAIAVALTGRVPCTVIGRITKGDCLTSSNHPGAAQRLDPAKFVPGCIVGKALQDHDSDSVGSIEVAVGRF